MYLFSKYVIPGIEARFIPKYWNERLGKEMEGRMMTLVRLRKDLELLDFLTGKFDNLEEWEQANLRRMKTDLLQLVATMGMLFAFGFDEDDEWSKKARIAFGVGFLPKKRSMLSRYITRIYEEQSQWYNPFVYIKKPIEGSVLNAFIKDIQALISTVAEGPFSKYKAGEFKGHYKAVHRFLRAIPAGPGY